MKTVLFTGFEPFGGAAINPALEAVKQLDGRTLVDGGTVRTIAVPVIKGESIDVVTAAIDDIKPDVVLMIGQASGRAAITPERIAINIDDFRIKDNGGHQVIDEPVVAEGPDAYFTDLPIKAMVEAMREAGVPAAVSNTAGTFVCNHLFYGVMHHLRHTEIKADFIHIPLIPEQAGDGVQPSMALETIVQGLEAAANAAVSVENDIKAGAGQIC